MRRIVTASVLSASLFALNPVSRSDEPTHAAPATPAPLASAVEPAVPAAPPTPTESPAPAAPTAAAQDTTPAAPAPAPTVAAPATPAAPAPAYETPATTAQAPSAPSLTIPATAAPAAPAPAATSVVTPAPVNPAPAAKPMRILDLSGQWNGSWQSCSSGHRGPMRASFCKTTDGNYQVTFVGRFLLLIPFHYTTVLKVTGYGDGIVYLTGSHYLGPIFGTFSFNGWANDRQFVANYTSQRDQGQFVLAR